MSEKTTALVYLLMRDHLPVGTVTRLVGEAQLAETMEYGTELGALAYRLGDMLDGDAPDEKADDDEPSVLQALDAGPDGGFNLLDGNDLSDEMVDWLDHFDDRIRGDASFVEAVNDAAEAGRPATEDTARLVADRVRELKARGK